MNGPAVYSLDTHVLFWHLAGTGPLSAAARDLFIEAAAGRVTLVVSHIVLAELFYVFQKHGQSDLFAPTLAQLEASPAYRIEGLVLDVCASSPNIRKSPKCMIGCLRFRRSVSVQNW